MKKPTKLVSQKREMFRGDTEEIDLDVVDPTTGAPLNLSPPAKLWFSAKGNVALPDNMSSIALDTDNGGIVVTDAVGGKATVTIPPLATRAFPDGPVTLDYDIQVKDSTGRITTIEIGTITVFPDVTRAIV